MPEQPEDGILCGLLKSAESGVAQAEESLPPCIPVSDNRGCDHSGDYRWHAVRGILKEIIEVRHSSM